MEAMKLNLPMAAVASGVVLSLLTPVWPTGPPPTVPGAVPLPMPTPVPVPVAEDSPADPEQREGEPGDQPVDAAGLREALLDATDFPAGWASDSPQEARERGIGVPRPEEPACRELFDSAADGAARAGFARTPTGPFVTTVAVTHPSPERARRAMAEFTEAAERCGTFRAREGPARDGATVVYETAEPALSAGDLEGVGTEPSALRYERRAEDGGGGSVAADVAIARVGAHTVRVAQAGREEGADVDLAELAARAVDKLVEVAAGGHPSPPPGQPGTSEL